MSQIINSLGFRRNRKSTKTAPIDKIATAYVRFANSVFFSTLNANKNLIFFHDETNFQLDEGRLYAYSRDSDQVPNDKNVKKERICAIAFGTQ